MAVPLRLVLATVLAAGVATSTRGAQRSNAGVQKVIQMLQDMSAKSKQEKADEEIAFAKFKTWCGAESSNLKSDIAKQGEEIELLTSDIGKLSNDAEELGAGIAKLQSDVSTFEGDKRPQRSSAKKITPNSWKSPPTLRRA
jgi:septal ring factor EnvC (AmiA/AmiB activator)